MSGFSHKDHVREHYNSHVNLNIDSRTAQQLRQQGEAYPLKAFHNKIKRQLLLKFARNAGSLLDLCCGRGGDIHKWREAGVKQVDGVDIADAEVAEAARRFGELQEESTRRRQTLNLNCDFFVNEHLGEKMYEGNGPYDVVTSMFAMHYFCDAEARLRMFLRNVSYNLKPGGHFIATVPDGHRVLWHMGWHSSYDSPMLRMSKLWEGAQHEEQPFGHRYFFAIRDTVTGAGGGASEGSEEFLTFKTPILRLAAHYRLVPVIEYGDPALEGLFEADDAYLPFKHFYPQFPSSDTSLAVASSVFMAVVFRKLMPDEEVPVLCPPLPSQLPSVLGPDVYRPEGVQHTQQGAGEHVRQAGGTPGSQLEGDGGTQGTPPGDYRDEEEGEEEAEGPGLKRWRESAGEEEGEGGEAGSADEGTGHKRQRQ